MENGQDDFLNSNLKEYENEFSVRVWDGILEFNLQLRRVRDFYNFFTTEDVAVHARFGEVSKNEIKEFFKKHHIDIDSTEQQKNDLSDTDKIIISKTFNVN